MTRSRDDLPAGIKRVVRDGHVVGYRVWQWVPWPGYPEGRARSKRFPPDATITAMAQWREEAHVDARRRVMASPTAPRAHGFTATADAYLEAVQAMPQFDQRRYHIALWADLFGEREPTSIVPHEIRAQRDRWLTRGPKWIREHGGRVLKPLPLSPQEVNLRLRALENFWTVMYPNQPNPVREVPECVTAGEPQARGQSFALAREVLAHMPDITAPAKGGVAEVGSLSRIRFETMLMTGLTHKQIGMLKESDVDYMVPSIVPPQRLKGRLSARRSTSTTIRRARPLLPSAVPVLKKFFAMGANQPFSRSSFWRTVKRAVRAANAERTARKLPLLDETLRPYDWTRHTFGTEVYRAAGDLAMVQELLGHSDVKLSAIYAQSAVREHVQATVAELDKIARPQPVRVTKSRGRGESVVRKPVRAGRRSGGEVGGEVSPPSRPVFDQSVRLRKRPKP